MAEAMMVDSIAGPSDSANPPIDYGDAHAMIQHLISCEDVYFKSQQRGDKELTPCEKKEIAYSILCSGKSKFLARFGKYLTEDHLLYFDSYTGDEMDGFEIKFYLNELRQSFSHNKRCSEVRNRRYDALRRLLEEGTYFSEIEMMKRNPLLYDQLVGQYLTEAEKKERDNIDTRNITFVNLLLESIERDNSKQKHQLQKNDEYFAMKDEGDESPDADQPITQDNQEYPIPFTKKWGEFDDYVETPPDKYVPRRSNNIDDSERLLLQDEFKSLMYQSFLDGKDAEFDYTTVDDNDYYDNFDIKNRDAEEQYFDSESPQETVLIKANDEESEDELDKYMNKLSEQCSMNELAEDLSNL